MSDDFDFPKQLSEIAGRIRTLEAWQRRQDRQGLLQRIGAGAESRSLSLRPPQQMGIGDSGVANTLGNVLQWAGQSNLLLDPTFESVRVAAAITLSTTEASRAFWSARYVVNSGASPSNSTWGLDAFRFTPDKNPSNSAMAELAATMPASASNVDFYVYNIVTDDLTPTLTPAAPFLVAALRVIHQADDWSAFDVLTARMEIVQDGSTVYAGEEYNLLEAPDFDYHLVSVATEQDEATCRTSDWRWRLRVHLEKSAVATPLLELRMVEPQLHFAFTPDPIPFTPAIANWKQGFIQSNLVIYNSSTLSQINSDQHNYGTNATVQRISSDAARSITGFSRGSEGFMLYLSNVGSFNITLEHEHASSSSGNRIIGWAGLDTVIAPDTTAVLRYDGTSARWRVVSA